MKNRKIVVVAFLLIAVLLLGVGYAAVSDVLDINGSADVNPDTAYNQDIYFSAAVANGDNTPNTATIDPNDNDVVTFTVSSLSGKGDTATFTFTITNAGDLNATVTPTLASDGNSNTEYFKITSDWKGQPKELASGGNATYVVTVELLKTPTTSLHGTFHIELTAVSDSNNNGNQ